MDTLDVSVENDARRMVCNILYYESKHDAWPVGGDVRQMGGYKSMDNKAEVMASLVERGMIEITREPTMRGGDKHRYSVTEAGRSWVLPPEAMPSLVFDRPVPLPSDEVEYRIYSYHLGFFERCGRWPNGMERATAFKGERSKKISPARRRQAYQDLVEDGTLVRVRFWNWRGEYDCYVITRYSPEYADKHGVLHFAPLDKT